MLTAWDRVLIVSMLLASVLSFYLVPGLVGRRSGVGRTAQVFIDGQVRKSLPLDGSGIFLIRAASGWCRLETAKGRVRVIAANCPRRLCVSQGWTNSPGRDLMCLPHRIVIAVEPSEGAARAMTVDAVVK